LLCFWDFPLNLTGDTRTLSKAERFLFYGRGGDPKLEAVLFMGKVAEKVDANVANRCCRKYYLRAARVKGNTMQGDYTESEDTEQTPR